MQSLIRAAVGVYEEFLKQEQYELYSNKWGKFPKEGKNEKKKSIMKP